MNSYRSTSETLIGESDPTQDLSIYSLRSANGDRLAAPLWESYELEVHSECFACADLLAA
jgi:hypothetical protein